MLIIHSCANTATCTFPTAFSNTVMSVYKYSKIIFVTVAFLKIKMWTELNAHLPLVTTLEFQLFFLKKANFIKKKSYLPNSAMFVVLCCSTLVLHSVHVVHNQHAEQKHLVLFFNLSMAQITAQGFLFLGGGGL